MDRNAQPNAGAESTETNRSNSNQQDSSQPAPRATFSAGSSGSSSDENSRRPDTPNVPQQPHVNITPNPFSKSGQRFQFVVVNKSKLTRQNSESKILK